MERYLFLIYKVKSSQKKVVRGLKRPNNVDIEYGLNLGGKKVDIAVTTERMNHQLRIYSLPDMKPIDNGGIPMFEGETGTEFRDLMGIALYKNPKGKIYAMVGRKNGHTTGGYIWQYELSDNGKGQVKATFIRKFGTYSGKKEIESIAVDDALGYVYYSDEGIGVRKYYAEPSKGDQELALFATKVSQKITKEFRFIRPQLVKAIFLFLTKEPINSIFSQEKVLHKILTSIQSSR
jgi:3-phytase